MSIFDLKKNQEGIITQINLTGSIAARLSALGITSGKRVKAVSFSLFKSSVLIVCGSVRLALRKSTAQSIEVTKC